MSTTITKTQTQLKDQERTTKAAISDGGSDLDSILENVKKADNVCAFKKCKTRTRDFAITCKHCNRRFCTTHGLPEIHGCGEAARNDERRKFLHPDTKLTQAKHEQASTKLHMKLRQMQLERKAKPGGSAKKK